MQSYIGFHLSEQNFVNTKKFLLTAGQDNEWKYAKLLLQIIKAEHTTFQLALEAVEILLYRLSHVFCRVCKRLREFCNNVTYSCNTGSCRFDLVD